jgi:hypothetical protein
MADDMKKNGGFIPGIKPGKAHYFIDGVISKITLPGSIFLAISYYTGPGQFGWCKQPICKILWWYIVDHPGRCSFRYFTANRKPFVNASLRWFNENRQD